MRYIKKLVALGIMLLVCSTCLFQNRNLRFTTIAQENFINYEEEHPGLVVIAGLDEIGTIIDSVLAEDLLLVNDLWELDYDRCFVIFALQGQKYQGGYSITVQRIVRQDNQISVYADFIVPQPNTRRIQAETSPYHLVSVEKQGEWGQDFQFVLLNDSESVAEVSLYIP